MQSFVASKGLYFHVMEMEEEELALDMCLGNAGGRKCNFQWSLSNVELSMEESVDSPSFSTPILPDVFWYLRIFFKYPGDLTQFIISLHRYPGRGPKTVFVDIEFNILCHRTETKASIIGTRFDRNSHFYNKSNTAKVDFQRNLEDCSSLVINCILCPSFAISMWLNRKFHSSKDKKLSVHLLFLLKSSLFYDMILCAGSEGFSREFKVHRAVLYARAPSLLDFETSDRIKAIGIIRIPFVSADVMKEVLHYVYSGQALTYSTGVSLCESAAILLKMTDLQKQLSWRDFPQSSTVWEYSSQSFLWELNEFFRRRKRIRDFSQNKIFRHPQVRDPIIITCKSLQHGDVEHLVFESRLIATYSTFQSIILSCTCRLICNSPLKEQELPVTFEHLLTHIDDYCVKILFRSSELFSKKHKLVSHRNTLKIEFNLRISDGTKNSSDVSRQNIQQLNWSQCPRCDKLSSDLSKLFLSPDFSDITITCKNGKQFPAHKAILAARDLEFRTLLEENEDMLILRTNYTEHALRKLLVFLYLGITP